MAGLGLVLRPLASRRLSAPHRAGEYVPDLCLSELFLGFSYPAMHSIAARHSLLLLCYAFQFNCLYVLLTSLQ